MITRTRATGMIAFLMLGVVMGSATVAATADPPPVLDDLVVTGERTGPGMWHVHRGDAHLWIMGSLSPLPKGITWRSRQLEELLATTNKVVVQKPFDIGIARILWLLITERSLLLVGGGKRLVDVMPPGLYARFAAQRSVYSDDPKKWERFRPLIAAAFLQQAAFHRVGLSTRLDLGAAVRLLAKKHGVRLEELKIAGVDDVVDAMKDMPASTENACVDASLVTVEKDLPRLVDRAQAWSTGNVERIAALRGPVEVDTCRVALDKASGVGDLIAQMRHTWLTQMDADLRGRGVTVAVVNLDMLLEKGGLLDELRAKGYEIDAP